MSLSKHELIRTAAPALRALLADGEALKRVRVEDRVDPEADLTLELSAENDAEVVDCLRGALQGAGAPASIALEGLATFRVSDLPAEGRVAGKVAIVTGAAQGFGLEIARHLAGGGACVALADINLEGVRQAAADLCAEYGEERALGLEMNVGDGDSIAAAIDEVVRVYGGFDVFIANAGVLRAESVKTQPVKDFDFVTSVNYKGYFLCVQNACQILAAQHRARPEYLSDIIQINSKSGLAGSNRNFAYAGGKFGGIGLTQSFAMELVEDGIKVNAICPGNFFGGPLWSDPDNGLFVQYLRTGKVPGAKTVEDVRRFYEKKVLMGRGCEAGDVMAAIYYAMEQRYETGQAIPVTGGQIMLK